MRQPLSKLKNTRPSLKATLPLAARALAFASIGGAGYAQTVARVPTASRPIAETGGTNPTMGWVRFCEQRPAECAVDLFQPATIELTKTAWQTIIRINQQVNAAITAKADKDH